MSYGAIQNWLAKIRRFTVHRKISEIFNKNFEKILAGDLATGSVPETPAPENNIKLPPSPATGGVCVQVQPAAVSISS